MTDLLLVGLLEFDGSMDPAVIVGDSHRTVYQEALRQTQHRDPETGAVGLAVDDRGWLNEHPFPDTGDVMAMHAWFKALMDSDLSDYFRLTIYAPPTEPGALAVLSAVFEPGDAKWIAAFEPPAPTTYREYDHEARPDDDPEPGDRCKTCGEDITWMGPSHTDWLHVNDIRNS